MGIEAHRKKMAMCGSLFCVALLLGYGTWSATANALGTVNVLERSYTKSRTGVNAAETVLAPTNVKAGANRFHKRFSMKVDGKIEGSPLYASAVAIAGGTHNVVYVATMHNTVYAFDADTGTQLSARWLGNPVTGTALEAVALDAVTGREYRHALCCAVGLRKWCRRTDVSSVRAGHDQLG